MLVLLSEVHMKPRIVDSTRTEWQAIPLGPTWVNPLGVNLVGPHLDQNLKPTGATALRMDSGEALYVSEPAVQVVEMINQAEREYLQ